MDGSRRIVQQKLALSLRQSFKTASLFAEILTEHKQYDILNAKRMIEMAHFSIGNYYDKTNKFLLKTSA